MVSAKLTGAVPLATATIPGNPSRATRHRWHLEGVLDANGHRIRLQCMKVGGRLYVTPEAVDRFIVALSADADDDVSGEPLIDSGRAAGKALEALGC
jgi:hypothetical protein